MYDSARISGKVAAKMVAKGALLFDTRSPVQFRDGTLQGAVNISARSLSILLKHPKTAKVIFFGDNDLATMVLVNYAIGMGFSNVYTFGDMENWGK